jgi:uncharacterized protein (DUF305 family)
MAMDDVKDMDHGAMGMMGNAEMGELHQLDGDEFDRRFMEVMVGHHPGAIDMVERVLAEEQFEEVAGFPQIVIRAQQTEIGQMSQWLEEWELA